MEHFSHHHRVVAVDLRGHGASDAPVQRYTIDALAEDVAWMCAELGLIQPIVVGHSLGGLVALALGARHPRRIAAAVMVDSVLLAAGDRTSVVGELVASLRAPDGDRALREYFATFFTADDDPQLTAWILDQAVRTQSSCHQLHLGGVTACLGRRGCAPALRGSAALPRRRNAERRSRPRPRSATRARHRPDDRLRALQPARNPRPGQRHAGAVSHRLPWSVTMRPRQSRAL